MGYTKLFDSLWTGSLYGQFEASAVFMVFLSLADKDGQVDMTPEAIAGRTGWPLDFIKKGIEKLEAPDDRSRTDDAEGRRILRLEAHRNWGWLITNHEKYREQERTAERREYFRLAKRKEREALRNRTSKQVNKSPQCHLSEADQKQIKSEQEERALNVDRGTISMQQMSGSSPKIQRSTENKAAKLLPGLSRGIHAGNSADTPEFTSGSENESKHEGIQQDAPKAWLVDGFGVRELRGDRNAETSSGLSKSVGGGLPLQTMSSESSRESLTITDATKTCILLREAGHNVANTGHPGLIAALKAGATPESIRDVANEFPQKPLAYWLSTVLGRLRDATKVQMVPQANTEALAAWDRLIKSDGADRAGPTISALESVGGWLRVKGRTSYDEPKLKAAFCAAYTEKQFFSEYTKPRL